MSTLWLLFPLLFAILVWKQLYVTTETFIATEDQQIIMDLYQSVLHRNPTTKEMTQHVKDIDKNILNLSELEIRLYNSDEYKRMIKTQDNGLNAELSRMIEEKEVITFLRELYFKARAQKATSSILLPLKDLFIYFDYNAYKLLALFRHTNYADFEDEFSKIKNLSKESLIELYHLRFDDSKLTQDGEALRKTEKLRSLGKQTDGVTGVSTQTSGLSMSDLDNLAEYIKKKLLEEEALKKKETKTTEDDGKSTTVATSANSYCTNQKYYLDPSSTILGNDKGFSVPQRHPPICIPIGEKHSVSPVVFGDLQGSTIEESKDTQVGSILPKFEFAEYIELPTSVKNCSLPEKK